MRILPRRQDSQTPSQSHSQLEALVIERTKALQNLSQRLLRVQDEERRKIARDLHDSTGQTLTALKISVALLQRKLKKNKQAYDELAGIEHLAEQALQEIRTSSYLLHPPLLDAAGFNCAARWYVNGFAKRSGTAVRMDFAEETERLPENIEVALFRVLQESLTNVHRHAGTSDVDICFRRDAQSVILEVRDYGCGLAKDPRNHAEPNSGVGLAGMRERLNDLKGKLELEQADPGTRLRAIVPLVAPMPCVLQFPRKKPSIRDKFNQWRNSALAARAIPVLTERRPNLLRWGVGVAAIALLTITSWTGSSDQVSFSTLEASNRSERQGALSTAEPRATRVAFKGMRMDQNEADPIAEDTIRYFTSGVASQPMWVEYKEVKFGKDVTVRYFGTTNTVTARAQRPSLASDNSAEK